MGCRIYVDDGLNASALHITRIQEVLVDTQQQAYLLGTGVSFIPLLY
jgi:hypothetical protein